jgi:hypothetical protein
MKSILCFAVLLSILLSGCAKATSSEPSPAPGAGAGASFPSAYTKPDDSAYKDDVQKELADFFPDIQSVIDENLPEDTYAAFTLIALIDYANQPGNEYFQSALTLGASLPCVFLFGEENCFLLEKKRNGSLLIASLRPINTSMYIESLSVRDGVTVVSDQLAEIEKNDFLTKKALLPVWEDAFRALSIDITGMLPYSRMETTVKYGVSGDVYFTLPENDSQATSPVYFWNADGSSGYLLVVSVNGGISATALTMRVDNGTKTVIPSAEALTGSMEPLDQEQLLAQMGL